MFRKIRWTIYWNEHHQFFSTVTFVLIEELFCEDRNVEPACEVRSLKNINSRWTTSMLKMYVKIHCRIDSGKTWMSCTFDIDGSERVLMMTDGVSSAR